MATMRKIDESEVTFTLVAEQDHVPVRGNAMASDDPDYDKKVEDEILDRLDRGDVWAWAAVTVRATLNACPTFVGEDHLGCCSYADEDNFKSGGYYDDMKAEALRELTEFVDGVRQTFISDGFIPSKS